MKFLENGQFPKLHANPILDAGLILGPVRTVAKSYEEFMARKMRYEAVAIKQKKRTAKILTPSKEMQMRSLAMRVAF